MFLVFFFKQKTAYEMRISDWSSDVCSSDLGREVAMPGIARRPVLAAFRRDVQAELRGRRLADRYQPRRPPARGHGVVQAGAVIGQPAAPVPAGPAAADAVEIPQHAGPPGARAVRHAAPAVPAAPGRVP